MSFFDKFESKEPGIEDTIEFCLRVVVVTLSLVILVVVLSCAVGMFVDNNVVDNNKIFDMLTPAFNNVIGAFGGLLVGLSLNREKDKPAGDTPAPEAPLELTAPVPEAPAPAPAPVVAQPVTSNPVDDQKVPEAVVNDHHDDEMAPWERYRNDLRYDANGDGVVDENDFPDWRSAGQ
jgi:hypothetical protein